jgi:CheY-like chemotaxis protein
MKPVEVMLVEDNAGDILMVKQALAGERYPVSIHVAVDGKQAVEIVSQGQFKPAVIILDLKLPKLSGLGFLEGYRPDVPVVVFTSSSNIHDQQRALELGVAEYIQKPTDLGEYARVVSQIVRNWAVPDHGRG